MIQWKIMPAEGRLLSSDGLKLFYRRWDVSAPKAACFVIHGLGEHSGRYDALIDTLTGRGFAVWAMDHRGHGRSQGRQGDCASILQFAQDLHRLILQETSHGQRPLPRLLIGHSLGGLIALLYATEHPQAIRAVAVSSPAFKLFTPPPKLKVAIAETLARILPSTPLPNGIDPRLISRDPDVVRAYQKDPLVHGVLTARCAVRLRDAMADSVRLAKKIRIPCLILQAGADQICDPDAAGEFAQAAPNPLVTFRRYEGLYHEVFNEPERSEVIGDLCQWMEQVAG